MPITIKPFIGGVKTADGYQDISGFGADVDDVLSTLSSYNLFDPIYKNVTQDGIVYTYDNGVLSMVGAYTGDRTRIILQTVNGAVGEKYSINCNNTNKPTIYIMNGTNVVATYRSSDYAVSFTMPSTSVTIEAYTGTSNINYRFLLCLTKSINPITTKLKHETANGVKYFGDIDYQAIGDSLTYGFTGYWNPDGTQKRIEKPYCEVVKDLLGFNSAINKGETGTTVANDIERMGSYYPMSHDNRMSGYQFARVISIMGGTNDYVKGVSLGTVYDGLTGNTFHAGWKRILTNLIGRFDQYRAFVFVIIPPVTTGLHMDNSDGHSFNDYIQATIEECRCLGVPVLDMSVYGRLSANNKARYTSDGIHFTQEYVERIFAPTVAEFIKQWFN